MIYLGFIITGFFSSTFGGSSFGSSFDSSFVDLASFFPFVFLSPPFLLVGGFLLICVLDLASDFPVIGRLLPISVFILPPLEVLFPTPPTVFIVTFFFSFSLLLCISVISCGFSLSLFLSPLCLNLVVPIGVFGLSLPLIFFLSIFSCLGSSTFFSCFSFSFSFSCSSNFFSSSSISLYIFITESK